MPCHEKLKERIIQSGLSYNKLSKELGIAKSTVYKKVNGLSDFNIVEAGALSAILDIPPEEIINFFA